MAPKSRFRELYPEHECPTCGFNHIYIPGIKARQKVMGQPDTMVSLVPFEVLGVINGSGHPGAGTEIDTPAEVVGLIWGIPGTQEILYNSAIYLN